MLIKNIIGRITSVRSPRPQSKVVSVGFHGSRERGGYAKLPKTESLYALCSSEICTVLNVVTVELDRQMGPEKAIFERPLKSRRRKRPCLLMAETSMTALDQWLDAAYHQWFQPTCRRYLRLGSNLPLGCLLSVQLCWRPNLCNQTKIFSSTICGKQSKMK